jgi:transcriptional regulator with XRE-family HTH domain
MLSNAIVQDNGGMDSMGSRIRTLREARGMSQTELAKIIGVSRGGVAQWELGVVTNIRLQAFIKLCDTLGTDPQYLIYGNDRGKSARQRT